MKQQPEHFVLRPGTLADVPQIVPVANQWAQETLGRDEFTVDSFAEEWRDPTLNLATDTRVVVLTDGTIAGCIEVWLSAPYVSHWLWACVDPALRGHGIGTAMMDWAEARVNASIGLAPDGARVTMTAASGGSHQPTIDLLKDRGFEAIRTSLTMERALDADLPTPVWPAGVIVDTMQPGQERAVYHAVDESFQDHWGHAHVPEDEGFPVWLHRMTERPGSDPSLWFLAVEGDEIAGVALCFPERGADQTLGWVSTLGVRRPWRKRGVGLALLYHAFGELRRRGCTRVGLGVDGQSLTGATRLYEKAGMRAITQWLTFEKELRPGNDLTTQTIE